MPLSKGKLSPLKSTPKTPKASAIPSSKSVPGKGVGKLAVKPGTAPSSSRLLPFDRSRAPRGSTKIKGVEGVRFAGVGKDASGDLYLRLVVGAKGHRRTLVVRAGDLSTKPAEVFSQVANAGGQVLTPSAKALFVSALQDRMADAPSFFVATKTGWCQGFRYFVHPAGLIGASDVGEVEFAPPEKQAQFHGKFRVVGSAKKWALRVGGLLRGNSLGITFAAAGLLSPLLAVLAEENFIFSAVGAPAFGKSTLQVAGSSQWGGHLDQDRAKSLGSAETAKHTVNDLDYLLLAHHDLGAFIDDLRSLRTTGSRAAAIEEWVLSATDGAERGRATSDKAAERFRSLVLTTANKSIQGEAVGSPYQADRAVLDRLIEIPLPEGAIGAFEVLHGEGSLQAFCGRVRTASVKYAGGTGVEFVRRLHEWLIGDQDKCIAWLQSRVARFIERHAGSQVPERVLRRFALIYAAGRLAIRFRLHPWTWQELDAAVAKSLQGHLRLTVKEAPGTSTAEERRTAQLLARLRDWYTQNRPEFLQAGPNSGLVAGSPQVSGAPGLLYQHHSRGDEVLLREDDFARLVRAVCSADEAKSLLYGVGVIAVDQNKHRRAYSVKRTVGLQANGSKWRPNLIALQRAALDPVSSPAASV